MTTWQKLLVVAVAAAASTLDHGGGVAVAQDAAVDAGTDRPEELREPVQAPSAALVQRIVAQETALAEVGALLEPREAMGAIRVRLGRHTETLELLDEATAPEELQTAGRSAVNENIRLVGAVESAVSADGSELASRLEELGGVATQLVTDQAAWQSTQADLDLANTPPSIIERIGRLLRTHQQLLDAANGRTRALVSLQESLVDLESRVQEITERLRIAQDSRRAELLSRVSPPIWADTGTEPNANVNRIPVERAWSTFLELYGQQLPVHVFLFLLFLVMTIVLGRWARHSSITKEQLAVLDRPIAAVLIISLLTARFVYSDAPSAIFHLLAALALAPLLRLLPVLLEQKKLRGPTWGLLGLFTLQELIVFAPLESVVHRWISLAITCAVLGTVLYVLRRGLVTPGPGASRVERGLPIVLRLLTVPLLVAILAEIFGYTTLAQMITPDLLVSFYVIWVFIAAVRVTDALFAAFVRSPKAEVSHAVRRHRATIEQNFRKVVHFVAFLAWAFVALNVFDVELAAEAFLSRVLAASLEVGSWSLSLGGLFSFGLVLWLTVQGSRLITFILDEDVLPRLPLPQGAPSTISRLTRYAVWALGFFFAVGAAGVDMSSVALLVSALGVGIGFGLQNIVNNFVSGLILIFERPIREGDMVEVGGLFATVKAIGLRASVVRTVQGAEGIVPNAVVISSPVTNWTLSDPKRRVDLAVGVAYGTDVQRVIDLLSTAADGVEGVVPEPAPLTLFKGFGNSSLDFEVRFWVAQGPDWPIVESAVATRISGILEEAEIEIPFPQRDLHLRSVDAEAAALLKK